MWLLDLQIIMGLKRSPFEPCRVITQLSGKCHKSTDFGCVKNRCSSRDAKGTLQKLHSAPASGALRTSSLFERFRPENYARVYRPGAALVLLIVVSFTLASIWWHQWWAMAVIYCNGFPSLPKSFVLIQKSVHVLPDTPLKVQLSFLPLLEPTMNKISVALIEDTTRQGLELCQL